MNKLISIVVPVYKVEEYLHRCIDSIINQTYKNLEIILVDDGSPDRCGFICNEYAQKDQRIKVIHKENGGLSDARNFGIQAALGEYILFVDSDDYIESNAVECLVEYMEKHNLDIMCGNAWRETIEAKKKLTKIFINGDGIMTGEEYMAYRILNGHFSAAVWNNMYRTKLITDNDIYFKKGLVHEDENWTPKILLKARRVKFIDFCFYHYMIRDNSITQKPNKEKNIKDLMETCFELEDVFRKSNINEKNRRLFRDYLARLYMSTATLGEYRSNFYLNNVDKGFVIRNANYFMTKIKMLIFLISIPAYRQIRKVR